jgi:antitoxin component YwqK of YwqJK toxin-antitoxin module
MKQGLSKTYYESGKLKGEAIYKGGRLNGNYKVYYEDGRLKEQGVYKHGVKKSDSWQYWLMEVLF